MKQTAVEWLVTKLPLGVKGALLDKIEQAKAMEREQKKDLAYWKANAEEDYIKVPISVLRYITELEKRMYSEEEVIAIVEKSRETGLTAEYLLLTEKFKKEMK
jgi:transcription initiation factor TFIIIB Brf1 subunit/transcription initiation factor TFIIB